MPYILKPPSILRQSRLASHCVLTIYRLPRCKTVARSLLRGDSSGSRKKLKIPVLFSRSYSIPSRLCPFPTICLATVRHSAQWEHNETGAVTDGALQTANGCAPASKSNFRKFRGKHDGRQTGRGRTIASGIPTRVGIPSQWMYCPRDNAAADCEAAGRKLDPKINRIARTPRSTAAKCSRTEYTRRKGRSRLRYPSTG